LSFRHTLIVGVVKHRDIVRHGVLEGVEGRRVILGKGVADWRLSLYKIVYAKLGCMGGAYIMPSLASTSHIYTFTT